MNILYNIYLSPSLLLKDLYKVNQTRNGKIVNRVNDVLIDFRNAVNKKEIRENEGHKILTPEQMLLRLPIALAQFKGGNTYNAYEKLLNEICQAICSLYRPKAITEKYITI